MTSHINSTPGKATSLLPLLKISYPLMLSCLSGSLMLLCDRFFLAKYSLGSFNALISFGALVAMLQIGINVCVCAADVFVGQFNGANKTYDTSRPAWQMIWISIFTGILFIPIAIYLPDILPDYLQRDLEAVHYCRLLIAFNGLSSLICAISAFFVGIKKTFTPMLATIAGNITNFFLNFLLIFGYGELVPELGIKGAAIATISGQGVCALILIFVFLSSYNRRNYHTYHFALDFNLMIKILKTGGPNAIAQAAIASAWSLFFILMQSLGEASITTASIMQTIFGFFVFAIQGLSRGVSTIVANLIGQRQLWAVAQVLQSGIKICLLFFIAVTLMLLYYPDLMVRLLFSKVDSQQIIGHLTTLKLTLFLGCLSFLLKSVRGLFSGLLTASGHTRFVMINEALTVWILFVLPVGVCIHILGCNIVWAYFISVIYNILTVWFYYRKFLFINWEVEAKLI